MSKVTIADHGAGNLHSVVRALRYVGADVPVTRSPAEISAAERVVVPGQGAFADCMSRLSKTGLDDALRTFVETGRPYLGICLGLQVLFEWSHEHGSHRGLGILPGIVTSLSAFPDIKIPHMGWNTVEWDQSPPFEGVVNGDRFYFVHSFRAVPSAHINAAYTTHGRTFVSAVNADNILACQFHPEKSARAGLALLKGFVS